MKAWRLHGVNELTCDEIQIPRPKNDEILIKVGVCGVCGSDIPRVFSLGTRMYPVTIGHEFSGTIVDVGEKEDKKIIGKKVAVFPLIPCRKCENCLTGNYAQCTNYNYLGSRSDGGFAEYCLVPSRWHLIFSDNEKTSLKELAMLEPTAVGLHALRLSKAHPLDNLVIFGAGPIGLIIAKWAKIFGLTNIMLIDIDDKKVDFAQRIGFENVINSKKTNSMNWIRSRTKGKGADVLIEGTGAGAALEQAVLSARYFGRITLLGNPHSDTQISLNAHSNILRKELTLQGIWNSYYADYPHNEWEYAASIIESGKIKLNDLITHEVGIDGVYDLLKSIRDKKEFFCKAMFVNQEL